MSTMRTHIMEVRAGEITIHDSINRWNRCLSPSLVNRQSHRVVSSARLKHQTQEEPFKSQNQQPPGCYNLGRCCVRSARDLMVSCPGIHVWCNKVTSVAFALFCALKLYVFVFLLRLFKSLVSVHQLKQALVKANRVISERFSWCLRPDFKRRRLWTL